MIQRIYLFISPLVLVLFLAFIGFQEHEAQDNFDKTVKVALRDIGNKLLLANKDSSSLVLPVSKVKKNHYKLEFQDQLTITPDSLVVIVNNSLKKAKLPKRYIVEVINCNSSDVSYSFKISRFSEEDIVPCLGRDLPTDCYTINVLFIESTPIFNSKLFLLLGVLVLLLLLFFIYKKRKQQTPDIDDNSFIKIGNYKFYQEQNKLIRNAIEIKLSAKECELMHMFSMNQNQIIKRDVLIKQIWEDNGVFVGRSLDTFISKLRKKFKDDDSINIINIHGVGYKLEVKD